MIHEALRSIAYAVLLVVGLWCLGALIGVVIVGVRMVAG